jgi:peptidoglycan/LPS O-acetylase OafA/YrhL
MDLVRSWTTAAVVYLVAALAAATGAIGSGAATDGIEGVEERITWTVTPALIAFLLMTVLAAWACPRDRRDRPARHALAVLLVPALVAGAVLVVGLIRGPAGATLAETAAAVAGTALGFGIVRLVPALR